MLTRALFVAAGLLAASPALADSVTAAVTDWNPATRTITLEDRSQFADIAATVAVPTLKSGDEITVDYYADEDGVQAITAITVNKDIAKRLTPNDKRG
jgi:hypothetical protein